MRIAYTYDAPRFECLLARMREAGLDLVMASGNQ